VHRCSHDLHASRAAAILRTLAEQEKATLLGLTVPDEAIQAFSAALLSMQLTADQLNS